MKRLAVMPLAALLLAACGGDEPVERTRQSEPVEQLSCADLRGKERLRRVARELTVKVVAPDGQSEGETADLIAGSLRATCAQPGRAGSRPVPEVLRAVQAHFDEEAIFEQGGH